MLLSLLSLSGIVYHCIRIQRIIISLGLVFFHHLNEELFEFMMSFNQNLEDIYFTSPEDIKGKIKFPANEEDVVEYDMDESPSHSRPYSMTEEYVLPNFKQNENQSARQAEINRPSPKKPVIQDEYDSDDYALARPVEDSSSNSSYSETTNVNDDENKDSSPSVGRYKNCHLTKTKIILIVASAIVVVGILSGVAIHFTSSKKGNSKYVLIF